MIKILNVYQNRHALIFVLRRIKYGSHLLLKLFLFEVKLAGQNIVPSLVFLGQIIHQSFPVGHHLQQSPSGVIVFGMRF